MTANRRRHSSKITNAIDELLASSEFDLAGLHSIPQLLQKCTDELPKANEALHAHMTDDEVLADMDSALEYENRTARIVGLLKHHIQELAARISGSARYNDELPTDSSVPRQAAQSDISRGTGARLPKLDLMRFDGSPTKWLPVRDLFRQSVRENARLNNVDQFHYLRSLLDGPSAKAIVGILTTENSCEDAVFLLMERFGGMRLIRQSHLKNLRTLCPDTTSVNASALRSLHDFVQINIRGLKGLGVSGSCYSAMLCEVLMKVITQNITVEYHR
ncbi:uncharacterized protein LOC142765788 [Rhipicephalus microplus]|uniref:uncharacterized protein LOC142765788 n=1 Tax=Rhipicephalus microplus TaxID=6941 RepID=UPI003F6CE1EB